MLPKQRRLSGREVKSIIKKGEVYNSKNIFVRFVRSSGAFSKFSVVVSKKISNKATDRNKIRRQIYDILRDFDLVNEQINAVLFVQQKTEFEEYKKTISVWLKNWLSS